MFEWLFGFKNRRDVRTALMLRYIREHGPEETPILARHAKMKLSHAHLMLNGMVDLELVTRIPGTLTHWSITEKGRYWLRENEHELLSPFNR